MIVSKQHHSFRARAVSIVPVVLVMLALLATVIAPTPAGGTDRFTDVADGSTHAAAIHALADRGVFKDTECGEQMFCPDGTVERWVMAVWFARTLNLQVSTTSSARFADVDASLWWAPYVDAVVARGITGECAIGPLRFCPNQTVDRAEMATLLVRAFGVPPAVAPIGFTDIGENTHENSINALAEARITTGCTTVPLRYCPNVTVTRAQMASFLHRSLMWKAGQLGVPQPTDPPPATQPTQPADPSA